MKNLMILILFAYSISNIEALKDIFQYRLNDLEDEDIEALPPFRNYRNSYQEFRPAQVRFAYQNPVRAAPTRAPSHFNQNPTPYTRPIYPQNPNPTFPPQQYTSPNPSPPPQEYRPRFITRRPSTPPKEEYEEFMTSSAQTQNRPSIQLPSTCPNQSRRNRQNGKCYELGTRAKCNQNMLFYADPSDQEFGMCDCTSRLNRPLVYHAQTDKCYFIFQQAYCQPGEWLILEGNRPTCVVNQCMIWTTNNVAENWNWTFNFQELNVMGPIALLNERTCTVLGWPCKKEGTTGLASHLVAGQRELEMERQSEIRLRFSGPNLACTREPTLSKEQSALTPVCMSGLINKWRLNGNCNNRG